MGHVDLDMDFARKPNLHLRGDGNILKLDMYSLCVNLELAQKMDEKSKAWRDRVCCLRMQQKEGSDIAVCLGYLLVSYGTCCYHSTWPGPAKEPHFLRHIFCFLQNLKRLLLFQVPTPRSEFKD